MTAKGSRRPSIYDVATLAGVSHSTVSRVLNDQPHISDSARQRVLDAIEQTNFMPSSIARALANKRAKRIGVVLDTSLQYGPNSTMRALESAARASGYAITAYSVGDEDGVLGIDAGVDELLAYGVDALCVIAPRLSSLESLRQRATGVPVLIMKSDPDADMHTAAVDQRAGAMMVMKHLLDLGHRSIAHIAGPLDWYDARARERAWREALAAALVTPVEPVIGDWSSASGYELGRSHDFGEATAIFAANDQMALGAIHGLMDRGLRVPEDVSVVGFDDLPDSRHFLPPLTTVRQDFAALGALAVELLVAAIEESPVPDRTMITPQLSVRASTAPPPSGSDP
ncbi:LacI family DNA-binding transcriptional regulator [Microbacterium sp. CFBP9034]|uniref:LacI family DNA-binding transcriptional regulator n=1 Tax=Microbacterium sp. CFBP9034 TaxID=3096540 RepID=UPI002A69B7E5|nr:LacI family DNA-binding transcriptional regulator [Microbacterium sp. CFBP9034]MDY0911191.1 LacI family DNA-binding transcriptional regulator [Microbacterium sp. CFBP9034]